MVADIPVEITEHVTAVPQLAAAPAMPTTHVRVIVPDADNLQYLAFWVARGAGYFADEHLEIELVVPDVPAQAIARVLTGEAPVAVLPPPVYLQLIADRFPIVLVANLLQNDPIDLVVRRSVFVSRGMDRAAPLADRLRSLHGLRLCVAPGPPTRLHALFDSAGVDADQELQVVIRRGPTQNAAFADGECDALYAHTPYLEEALDDQDAVMLVDQSSGEVPALATRQIHTLAVSREFLLADRATVVSLVRAIGRAETLVHADPGATVDAVLRALPSLDRRHVQTLVSLYQPAVPATPRVSIDGLGPALALFPASRVMPSLEGVPLADFVEPDLTVARPDLAQAPPAPLTSRRSWLLLLAAAVLTGAVLFLRIRSHTPTGP
jgi:ABC-type nitrate/sulfonate/bicarbonate transport system substrate-binding protein